MAPPRVIALDLGGTKLLSGVVDDAGVVEKRVVGATDTSSEDAVLAQVEEAAEQNPEGDLGRAAAEGKTVDARLAVDLAAHGPGDARDVLSHVGFHLGVGIASLVNIFNPELVVIGGGFARAGDLLFEPARRVVRERALSPARDEVKIVPALLGVEAGLIGAGLVGFEALHRES